MTACHTFRPAALPNLGDADERPVIALVGRPNVGKSTLLAEISGRFAETANAPGTTVGTEQRLISTASGPAWLVDLPGTTSLLDTPAGDDPFWVSLLATRPDAIVVVGTAGDIARHLPLALACRDLGLPIVFVANLADEAAAHGIELDTGRLSQLLLAPVHLTVGRTGHGVSGAFVDAVRRARRSRSVRAGTASPRGTSPARVYPPALEHRIDLVAADLGWDHSLGAAENVDELALPGLVASRRVSPRGAATLSIGNDLEAARWQVARAWAALVERRGRARTTIGDRIGAWSISLWPGLPLFVIAAAASFALMMVVGGTLSGSLTGAWSATASPVLGHVVRAAVPVPAIAAALLWGLDGGVLAMLSVGIPYVLTFYVILALLEDSGYLTSAAVLTDRLFNTLGLPGRAAIPILAATGCNVPAIYGTRVLATRREQILASFLVTMTPCSARSAVVVAALVPFVGPLAALVAFGLIAAITIASGVGANAMIPGRQPALVLELAPIRRPVLRLVLRKAWLRFGSFVWTATPVMLAGSIILGFLYESGGIWPIAGVLQPVVGGWLGLPSVAGLALVFAFLRKELALQLLVTLAVVEFGAGAASLGSFMSPGQLFVYAIVTSVSVPCIATLAALAGEFGWRVAATMSGATLVIAIGTGGILARVVGVA